MFAQRAKIYPKSPDSDTLHRHWAGIKIDGEKPNIARLFAVLMVY